MYRFFLAAGTDQAVRFGGKASVTMPVGARAARASLCRIPSAVGVSWCVMTEASGLPSESALFELVYGELRRLASSYMRQERQDHTLQTSALVNEAYLRLAGNRHLQSTDRQQYLRVASHAMRHVLVDHARRRSAQKREGGVRVNLEEADPTDGTNLEDLLVIDTALHKLAEVDARQADIVELRYFGGLSVPETAEALNISEKTVKRDWAVARAWLRGELDEAAQM